MGYEGIRLRLNIRGGKSVNIEVIQGAFIHKPCDWDVYLRQVFE